MKRRKFIKHSGIVAGGFMFPNQLLKALTNTAEEKMNVGVIGCGDRGKGIMHIMKQLPQLFSIKAVCDVLDIRLAETKKIEFPDPFKEYKDYLQLLNDKTI